MLNKQLFKHLASVSRLSPAGHNVVFDEFIRASYVDNKNTSVTTWLRPFGEVYFGKFKSMDPSPSPATSSFCRRPWYKYGAHRDLVRPKPTIVEASGADGCKGVNEKAVEELEKEFV